MSISEFSGPVVHIGSPAILAFVFKLNPIVTVFCGILPDLVDKPLAVLGIGGGRYIGHTLLFALLVIVVFSLWKKKFGLAACAGLTSHLLLDLNELIPWFYPFKNYRFVTTKMGMFDWLKSYLTFSHIGFELIVITLAGIVVLISWWLYRRYCRRKKS
jgi:hypothetical protein